MQLCHYLSPEAIVSPVKGKAKVEVLRSLVSALAELHHLKQPKRILHAILEREKAGSTFLPIGVAIPHARLAGVDEIKVVLGILPEGVDEIIDGNHYAVSVICLFVSPMAEEEFGRHLKLLAQISALFREERLVQELVACKTPAAAFALLQRRERDAVEKGEEETIDLNEPPTTI
ncbi:MAG: PTS sugar transporter subunit IIA [Deltaproteobacteria bacterium]|nr:PTS sugar transporter subunit IIA [Deltaproteobacteria bacterium]